MKPWGGKIWCLKSVLQSSSRNRRKLRPQKNVIFHKQRRAHRYFFDEEKAAGYAQDIKSPQLCPIRSWDLRDPTFFSGYESKRYTAWKCKYQCRFLIKLALFLLPLLHEGIIPCKFVNTYSCYTCAAITWQQLASSHKTAATKSSFPIIIWLKVKPVPRCCLRTAMFLCFSKRLIY